MSLYRCDRREIEQFLKDNPESTLGELNAETGAGVGCGSCMNDVKLVFDSSLAKTPQPLSSG